MMDFVDQKHWDNVYSTLEYKIFSEDDSIIQFIQEKVPSTQEIKDSFEIGCFPGRYMPILGKKGYRLNGIDLTPRTGELEFFLADNGFSVGKIKQGDFFNSIADKYDFVCSFGFIEHFFDYNKIIIKHLEIIKDNGYVLIMTPNFRGGLQYLYHRIFDYQNLKMHNIKSMCPQKWKKLALEEEFEIISCGYLGKDIWRDADTKQNITMRILEKILIKLMLLISKLRPNNPWTSGYCYILVKKTAERT